MTAKAESIAQRGSYSSFLGLIESEVQLVTQARVLTYEQQFNTGNYGVK